MKLGIAFSGGGVKGAAHIGVLKAMEEENIKFEYISGTSSGSIIATLYAIGYSPDEIYTIFKKYCNKIKYIDMRNIIKIIMTLVRKRKIEITGLNTGKIIENIINDVCEKKGIKNIMEVKVPLLLPSVNIQTCEIYIFTSNSRKRSYSDNIVYINDARIGLAVRASCSYPGIFSPCEYNGIELIDGGIRENIPWKETKKMGADRVICVIFDKEKTRNKSKNLIDIVSNSFDILCHELSNYELNGADYILKIKTPSVHLLDINEIDRLYKMGYQQTKKEINKIKQINKKY